ncbi:MAG: transglutaminase family protein [Verrucomicrobiales bacterium]|nr:transglutaminase family protein [Verrucomicrobiales bacterium]
MEEIRYRVRHLTSYRYSGRVDLCHSLAHLTPREEAASLLSHRLEIQPRPDFQSEQIDYFGNHTHYFSIQSSHAQLAVTTIFTIEKNIEPPSPALAGLAWDQFQPIKGFVDESGVLLEDYVLPSHSCPVIEEVKSFLQPSLVPGKDLLALADEVMGRIFTEFTYKPGATDTDTPIKEALSKKEGVCQDFAHVMIACFRSLGVPTRYVSGYLETLPPPGKPKLQGADASHAWVEVYFPVIGWIPFDPTNNQRPGERHIKLCHGRDYFDVQPLRGIFLGSGSQILSVEVDVERL